MEWLSRSLSLIKVRTGHISGYFLEKSCATGGGLYTISVHQDNLHHVAVNRITTLVFCIREKLRVES